MLQKTIDFNKLALDFCLLNHIIYSLSQWSKPLVMGYSACWVWLAGSLQH